MAEHPQPEASGGRVAYAFVYLLAAFSLLVAGGGVYAYLTLTRPKPGQGSEQRLARLVRVFEAQRTSHRLAITAYGTSRAAEVWTAIAEVKGRTVEVNPLFEAGEILPAGTLLVRIDPTDYQLARDRCQAEAEAKRLQVNELNQSEKQLREILKLQERQLQLAEAEYEREREIYAKKAAPLSALETAENAYVMQQTAVQKTRNNLALVSVQRLQLEAMLKAATVQLEQAGRDLSRCQIWLPLDGRCASKSVEVDQFVTVGERLGTFLTLKAAEVVAMAETRKVAALLRGASEQSQTLDLSQISQEESLWQRFRIPVEVRWALGAEPVVWPGRLVRVGSSLDPGTRTLPLIIEVPYPYKDIQPGIRPPLLPDVFCEVTAYGATVDGVVVIPRDALHDHRVYLLRDAKPVVPSVGHLDTAPRGGRVWHPHTPPTAGRAADQPGRVGAAGGADVGGQVAGKLHIQPVELLSLEEDLAVIQGGIEPGDLVILSDVPRAEVLGEVPLAIEDMPLRGELVNNPVKARQKIDFPDYLFDKGEDRKDRAVGWAPAEDSPATPPTPPASQPRPELRP
jgi:multidrug efflux pump subunit AcrA (membrane-fusion protein)